MFRIIIRITFVLFLSIGLFATDYYVKNGGDDGLDGQSDGNAWETLSKVNGISFNAGDTIHLKRDSVWNERLNPSTVSGSNGSPITVTDYGEGALPIINLRSDVPGWDTGGNWTWDAGNADWRITLSGDPRRIWLSDTEYVEASSRGTINSTNRWRFDSSTLYVYTPGAGDNPATYYSDIERGLGSDFSVVYLEDNDYWTFENIETRGSARGFECVRCDYLVFDNVTTGKYACSAGIHVVGKTSSPYTPSTGGEIKNCTIVCDFVDSGYSYSISAAMGDGVTLNGSVTYWKVHDNTITDWGHSGVYCGNTENDNLQCQYNEIYDNEISAANRAYCRGFDFDGTDVDGTCAYNKAYRNYIHDTSVRIQVHGNHNEVYYNIVKDIHNNGRDPGDEDGIALFAAQGQKCHHNKIYNNVIYDIDQDCLYMTGAVDDGVKEDNLLRNNVCMNWGSGYYGIRIGETASVKDNTWENNCVYKSGVSNSVYYKSDGAISVATFNGKSEDGDTIADNIASDPAFLGGGTYEGYDIATDSPLKDAGTDVGLSSDYEGVSVPQGSDPDIGLHEFDQGATYHKGHMKPGSKLIILPGGKVIIKEPEKMEVLNENQSRGHEQRPAYLFFNLLCFDLVRIPL